MNHIIYKKSIATCSCLWLLSQPFLTTPLRAQDSTNRVTRSAIIKTNLTGPFSGLLEISVVPRRSVQLSGQWSTVSLFGKAHFFSLTADYRFYNGKLAPTTLRPAPKGFYWGPYVKYRTIIEEKVPLLSYSTYTTINYSMFGGGVVAGKQFINRWGLTIDAFFGIGYFPIISSQVTVNIPTYRPDEAKPQDYQLDIRPGVCVGFAF